MNITEIEALTEAQVKEMAEEMLEIKEHNVYLIDLGEYFGYSMVIFKNNHHIYYANDYESHNSYLVKDKERADAVKVLRERYIEEANHKLFTEEEILGDIKDYDDYSVKAYFLRNYYIMQIDYETAFVIGDKKQKELEDKIKENNMSYNPISFCFVSEKDVPFCKHQAELLTKLEIKRAESEKSYDYMKEAFIKEMYNHEYQINWDGDLDVLSAFGKVPREIVWERDYTLNELFDALDFTETQRRAYRDAKKEYYRQIEERGEWL